MEGGSRKSVLTEKGYIHTYEEFTRNKKWQTNTLLRGWHYRTVSGSSRLSSPISNSTGGDDRVHDYDLKKPSAEDWPDKGLYFLSISSQQSNLLTLSAAAVCCLLQSVSSDSSIPASVSPGPSANFQTITVLSLVSSSSSGSSTSSKAFS